jgi:hypothetical protein
VPVSPRTIPRPRCASRLGAGRSRRAPAPGTPWRSPAPSRWCRGWRWRRGANTPDRASRLEPVRELPRHDVTVPDSEPWSPPASACRAARNCVIKVDSPVDDRDTSVSPRRAARQAMARPTGRRAASSARPVGVRTSRSLMRSLRPRRLSGGVDRGMPVGVRLAAPPGSALAPQEIQPTGGSRYMQHHNRHLRSMTFSAEERASRKDTHEPQLERPSQRECAGPYGIR